MKNLTPITRKEMFMAKAAGQEVTTPEPITREEMFLSDIAEHEEGQSGGGSSGGGALRVIDTNGTLNVTYNDLNNALQNGILPYILSEDSGEVSVRVIDSIGTFNGMYGAQLNDFYSASSPTEYLKKYEEDADPIG